MLYPDMDIQAITDSFVEFIPAPSSNLTRHLSLIEVSLTDAAYIAEDEIVVKIRFTKAGDTPINHDLRYRLAVGPDDNDSASLNHETIGRIIKAGFNASIKASETGKATLMMCWTDREGAE